MGALNGDWRIVLHISPTTWSFCSIIFAMIFILLKHFKTVFENTKHDSVWCAGWSDTAYGCSKSRVHAAAAEAGGPNLHVSSSAAPKSLHSRAELETCKLGPPALGACKKYTHFGPQITPSGKLTNKRWARACARPVAVPSNCHSNSKPNILRLALLFSLVVWMWDRSGELFSNEFRFPCTSN